MGSSRNHHYVPQLYLRNFSPGGRDDGAIRLINLARRRYVASASIKAQCKRVGFHDYNPGLERALSILEGAVATVIRNIIERDVPPAWHSTDHATLAAFIAIQRSRTAAEADKADEMADILLKVAYEEQASSQGVDIWRYTIKHKYPIALPLSTAAQIWPHAVDLGIHLFVNETDEEFVTSDNPVVAHNKFCEGITHRGVLGWYCAGILIVFPLSARHAVLLYDSDVYAVGPKKESVSRIIDVAEVRNINAFQILNAVDNIYFNGESMVGPLLSQIELLASKRRVKRSITVQTGPVADGDRTSEIIHQYERLIPLEFQVASVRIKRSMRRVPLNRRVAMYRRRDSAAPDQASPEPQSSILYPVRRSFST